MRVAWIVFGVGSMWIGGAAIAAGCGLDPISFTAEPSGDGSTTPGPTATASAPALETSAPEGGSDADDGGSVTDDGGNVLVDGGTDLDDSGLGTDADAGACPNECSSCSSTVCQIRCPGPKCSSTISCPAGRACRVVCATSGACDGAKIACAVGQPCRIHCEDSGACTNLTIEATLASRLCVECDPANGNPSCAKLTCDTPLSLLCGRSCSNGSCSNMGACGNCVSVSSCP